MILVIWVHLWLHCHCNRRWSWSRGGQAGMSVAVTHNWLTFMQNRPQSQKGKTLGRPWIVLVPLYPSHIADFLVVGVENERKICFLGLGYDWSHFGCTCSQACPLTSQCRMQQRVLPAKQSIHAAQFESHHIASHRSTVKWAIHMHSRIPAKTAEP